MSKEIENNNYFIVQGWMIKELHLKGTELLLYAIIYGYSQNEGNEYRGSLQYLCNFTNTSKPTVIKALQNLVDKDLLIKNVECYDDVKFNRYKANLQVVKKLNYGSKETLQGGLKNFTMGGKETVPNNKHNINKNDNKHIYGEYQNVKLTEEQYNKLQAEFGNADELIKYLDEYIQEKPNYKSQEHYLAIRRWVIDAVEKQQKGNKQGLISSYDINELEQRAMFNDDYDI